MLLRLEERFIIKKEIINWKAWDLSQAFFIFTTEVNSVLSQSYTEFFSNDTQKTVQLCEITP